MNIPKLKKIKTTKNYHGIPLEDDYSWVDQPNILEVLKDPKKLNSQVKDYIEANNKITEDYFTDVKELQKNLFNEIKGKIKLDDTGLKYKDKRYYYWSKTEAKGNYGKRMRQLIDGSKPEEVFFDLVFNNLIGSDLLRTAFSSIITFSRSSLGRSNIVSINISSIIERSPLAPVFLSIAFFAITLRASFESISLTSSMLNNV